MSADNILIAVRSDGTITQQPDNGMGHYFSPAGYRRIRVAFQDACEMPVGRTSLCISSTVPLPGPQTEEEIQTFVTDLWGAYERGETTDSQAWLDGVAS